MARRFNIRNKELKIPNESLRNLYPTPKNKSYLLENKVLSKNFFICDQTKLFFANNESGSGESSHSDYSGDIQMTVSNTNGGDLTGCEQPRANSPSFAAYSPNQSPVMKLSCPKGDLNTTNASINLLSSSSKETNPVPASDLIHVKQKILPSSPEHPLAMGCDPLSNPLNPLHQPTCHFCGLFGSLRCTQCKQIYYCSVDCQKKDWQVHSVVCKPVKQNTDKVEDNAKSLDEIKKKCCLLYANANKTEQQGKKTKLSDLNTMGLKKNMRIKGTVMEFNNPSEFYVQVDSPEVLSNIGKLCIMLKNHYELDQDEYIPTKGEVCVAKYSMDQMWYRVLIEEVDILKKRAQVLYIDYGNRENAVLQRIKQIHKDIAPFPPCAIKCCVANVVPPKKWDARCSSTLAPLLVGKYCSLTIVDVLMDEMTYSAVDVVLPSSGKHLHELLFEMGHGLNPKDTNSNKENSATDSAMEKISIQRKITELKLPSKVHRLPQSPKVISLSKGDEFLGMVAHIQTPGNFFCQRMENSCKLSDLQISLHEYCDKIATTPDFCPAIGEVCCAQFTEDNRWYRASVLSNISEKTVLVGYVDYGNVEVLQLSSLRPIVPKLMELPVQAIKCTLAGVKPISGTWSTEATSKMKRLVQNKAVTVKVLDKNNNTFMVELADKSVTPIMNVSKCLLESGCAVKESGTVSTVLGTLQEVSDQKLEKVDWTWVTVTPKQVVHAMVCVLYSPSEFYCQLLNDNGINSLKELNTSLVEYCEKTVPIISKVTKGEPCCAYFSGDGKWYRALVKEATSSNTFKVQFVDYGNSEDVTLDKLRQISPAFLKLPFQAVRCWLSGITPINKEWSKEVTAILQMNTAGKKLQARVVSLTTNGAEVELIDPSTSSPITISEILIKEHLALKKEAMSKQNMLPGKLATSDFQEMSTYGQWKTAEFPVNETLSVRVIEVINPDLFYVVPVKAKVDPQKLHRLITELTNYCNTQNDCLFKPKVGEACCARFSGDGLWYRAVVLEIAVSEVKVAHADYGNVETLPFSRLQPITGSYLELPVQIFKCSLAGIMELDGQWHESATEKLKNLLLNEHVIITVKGIRESVHAVTVIKSCESGILNVADQLVIENMAKYSSSGNQCAMKAECCCTELRKQVAKLEQIIYFLLKDHFTEDKLPEMLKPLET